MLQEKKFEKGGGAAGDSAKDTSSQVNEINPCFMDRVAYSQK